MADTKTSLEAAANALDGTEIIRGVQAGGNVKLTINQIATKVLAGAVSSVNTRTGAVALTATDVGLSLVNNTADASKPVSAAQAAADSAVATNASTALTAHTSNIANPHAVTPSQIGAPTGSGTSTGTNTGDQTNIAGNAATVTTNANLTGDITSVGNATTLTNAPVIAKVLTGYVSGAGTVAATDSILAAIQKVNGNDALKAPLASPTFTGTVALPAGQVVNGVTLTAAGLATNYLTAAGTYAAVAGGGTPGGSTTQLQYNNAGAFAGMSGTAWDDTNRSLVVTGATVTTSKPLLDLAQTWNNAAVAFTGIKANVTDTASAAASGLMDLQVGGTSKFYVRKDGQILASSIQVSYRPFEGINIGLGSSIYGNNNDVVIINSHGFALLGVNGYGVNNAISARSDGMFGWSSTTTITGGIDTGLARNAAGVVEVNNSTAGAFRDLKLRNLIVDNVVNLKNFTVATLPSAATSGAGAQAYVTDALTPAYNTTVTGGGAVKITVTADGTNWKT